MVTAKVVIHWFRRDLRLDDNHALYKALSSGYPVVPLFIFDTSLLEDLPSDDKRVSLIYDRILDLDSILKKHNSGLLVEIVEPLEVFKKLVNNFKIEAVYTNEDYEPYAIARDNVVGSYLAANKIEFRLFTDHVLLHPSKVKKKDGNPYTIFTPWSKQWRAQFDPDQLEFYPSESEAGYFGSFQSIMPSIEDIGFQRQNVDVVSEFPETEFLDEYEIKRNFPAVKGTSRLGVALRFGMLSIRKLVHHTKDSYVYLNELGWREFYMMILYNFPQVVTQSFKSKYDNIKWRNNEDEFELWKNGKTGYPIVDAGMRELYETGYMHNRVRMITASFLTKHLLIDWRWGESWFAEKLLDFELASNNGGWQWAAGTGCDAAPYFRVFSPEAQTKKFDPEMKYIRKWVPEIDSFKYVSPIVDHRYARERALETYKKALK